MINVITLNNGNTEIISNMKHFEDLVYNRMGTDARNYLSNEIEKLEYDANYTQAKIDTDLSSYEFSLESNTSCFIEILDIVEELKIITNSKRVNISKMNELLDNINTLINNQI